MFNWTKQEKTCTFSRKSSFSSYVVSLVPFSFHQPPTSNWHKMCWTNCFSVFMLQIAWKRLLPRKVARFVLFRPIKKRSFNLLCVLDLFSERWQSTLFKIFFFFLLWSVQEISRQEIYVTGAVGNTLFEPRRSVSGVGPTFDRGWRSHEARYEKNETK